MEVLPEVKESAFDVYYDESYYAQWKSGKKYYASVISSCQDIYNNFKTLRINEIAQKYPWLRDKPEGFASFVLNNKVTASNYNSFKTRYFRKIGEKYWESPLSKEQWELYARFHKFSPEINAEVVKIFIDDLITIQLNNGWEPTLDYETLKTLYVKPAPNYNSGLPYLPKGGLHVRPFAGGDFKTISERYETRKPNVHDAFKMIKLENGYYFLGFDRSEKYTPEKWEKEWSKIWKNILKEYPNADGYVVK